MTLVGIAEAVRRYLEPILAGDDSLIGIEYALGTTFDDEELPGDRAQVLVHVSEEDKSITRLVDAMAEILVVVPVDVIDDARAVYRALEVAVAEAFDRTVHPTATDDLNSLVAAEMPGWNGGGYFVTGIREGRDDSEHVPVFAVKVGAFKV